MNEESTGLVMAELKCKLCDATITETPCPNCQLLTRDDLIEAAHLTIQKWRTLLAAVTIMQGRSTLIAPFVWDEARRSRIVIGFTPFQFTQINVVPVPNPVPGEMTND